MRVLYTTVWSNGAAAGWPIVCVSKRLSPRRDGSIYFSSVDHHDDEDSSRKQPFYYNENYQYLPLNWGVVCM